MNGGMPLRWQSGISLRSGLTGMADLLCPRECVVCGRRLGLRESHICLGCLAEMPYTRFWERADNPMSEKYNASIEAAGGQGGSGLDMEVSIPLGSTPQNVSPFEYAAALFFYNSENGYKFITRSLKYHGDIPLGRYFSGMLARRLSGSGLYRDVTAIVPVPLHWTRQLSRGYNQAEVIAGEIALELAAPVWDGVLLRSRRTRTQTKVGVQGKSANVMGAFSTDQKTLERLVTGLADIHILLVDDVFTTGSTMAACHKALSHGLRELGLDAFRISCATLAFVSN